jgi:hypothetical protein
MAAIFFEKRDWIRYLIDLLQQKENEIDINVAV